MKNKRFMLLSIFLITFLSISAVSAAEISKDIVSTDMDDDLVLGSDDDRVIGAGIETNEDNALPSSDSSLDFDELSSSDNGIIDEGSELETSKDSAEEKRLSAVEGTGDFNELNEIIQNGENELKITKNYTYDFFGDGSFRKGISINADNLIIDGQGFTLSGANLSQIFIVNGNNITIKNLNFINPIMRMTDGEVLPLIGREQMED